MQLAIQLRMPATAKATAATVAANTTASAAATATASAASPHRLCGRVVDTLARKDAFKSINFPLQRAVAKGRLHRVATLVLTIDFGLAHHRPAAQRVAILNRRAGGVRCARQPLTRCTARGMAGAASCGS